MKEQTKRNWHGYVNRNIFRRNRLVGRCMPIGELFPINARRSVHVATFLVCSTDSVANTEMDHDDFVLRSKIFVRRVPLPNEGAGDADGSKRINDKITGCELEKSGDSR